MSLKHIFIIMAIVLLITLVAVVIVIIKSKSNEEYEEIINEVAIDKQDIKKEKIKIAKKKKVNINPERENFLIDYNEYKMTKQEKIKWAIVGIAIVFGASFIFYRHIVWSALLSIIGIKYVEIKRKEIIKKRKEKLLLQFKEALYVVSTSLSAGKSVENAFIDAKNDLEAIFDYGNEKYIIDELIYINRRIEMNKTIEDALDDFADRSGLEDVRTFANVFSACKRTGGNLKSVTEMTSRVIGEKITTKQDIKTLVAGKKFEATALTFIPFGIILFIQITAPEFISTLYTFSGRLISTGALLVIMIATIWAQKIMDIEV